MSRIAVVVALLMTFAIPACAWDEPKDGKLTEKQLVGYIGLTKDLLAMAKEQGNKIQDAKSEVAAIAAAMAISGKFDGLLKKHGMVEAEWHWVAARVFEAAAAIFMEETLAGNIRGELAKVNKENDERLATLRERIASLEKALKEGQRVLTKEQRDEIVNSAKENRQSALEEARSHAEQVKAALDEAALKDKEAAEAEKLAGNPPADVEKENRAEYSNGKREEARAAREAALEARKNALEAQKLERECREKAASFGKQAENPALPRTAEEKEQVERENREQLTAAREEVTIRLQGAAELIRAAEDMEKSNKAAMSQVNADNLTLVRGHFKELKLAWGIKPEEKK